MKQNKTLDIYILFIRKESLLIAGKGFFTFWFLCLVFAVTFLAMGFANGSKSYLEEKMSDFFIRWVPVNLELDQDKNSGITLQELAGNDSAKTAFLYEKVIGNNFHDLNIYDYENLNKYKNFFSRSGQSLDTNSDLLKRIAEKKIVGTVFRGQDDPGVIVTEKMLNELHYPKKTPFVIMAANDSKGMSRQIPIPVRMIVENKLPGNSDLVFTQYFYENRRINNDENPFNPSQISGIYLLSTETNPQQTGEIMSIIASGLKKIPGREKYNFNVDTLTYPYSHVPCMKFIISMIPDPELEIKDSIFNYLSTIPELKKKSLIRFYDFHREMKSDFGVMHEYEQFYIQFKKLDSLEAFSNFLLSKHKLTIDMADIESRKNYNFVSTLTGIISWVLILFSGLCVCLFVYNVLRGHLRAIKMNIGTFSAFGMAPSLLDHIYLFIMSIFLVSSLLVGLGLASLIGYSGGIKRLLILLDCNIEPGRIYFELGHWSTMITIIIFLLISYISLKMSSHKIFYKTPGDLVYNRED